VRRTNRDRDPDQGDEFLSRLLREGVAAGEIANELLSEFQQGYPISKLRILLGASNLEAVAAGVWIASELGSSARPVFNEIAGLLHSPSARVRFFALDSIHSCARPEDENEIRGALDLVEDREPSVRWKALVFLATLPVAVVRAARQAAAKSAPNSACARGLKLLESSGARDAAEIAHGLADRDIVLRRYAAAAAARVADRDPGPLRLAMKSEDETIRQFAEDMAARAGVAE